jgi:hypothetical protein
LSIAEIFAFRFLFSGRPTVLAFRPSPGTSHHEIRLLDACPAASLATVAREQPVVPAPLPCLNSGLGNCGSGGGRLRRAGAELLGLGGRLRARLSP